jgi:hypothetical protein
MHKGQAPLRLVVPTSAYNSAENCMPKSCSKSTSSSSLPLDVPFFPVKQRKPIPHEFVLDEIASLSPRTRLMFGCLAIYVQQRGEESGREKIVLFLRDKPASPEDNGVWLATTYEHHESLREEFQHAVHQGAGQRRDRMASLACRLRRLRRIGPPGLRTRSRLRSKNRKNSWRASQAAGQEKRSQKEAR